MADTGFCVPAAKRDRFTTFYAPGTGDDGPRVLDRPDGWWAAPPKFPDASGALVSTVDDLYAFASMLAADGRTADGGRLLSVASVRQMTRDRMTAAERAESRIFVGDHSGSGTAWRTDTSRGLTGILLTQRMATSPEPIPLVTDFWAAAYAAIEA
jgi:CubicO group peptidase (beta-lactamase class C family)